MVLFSIVIYFLFSLYPWVVRVCTKCIQMCVRFPLTMCLSVLPFKAIVTSFYLQVSLKNKKQKTKKHVGKKSPLQGSDTVLFVQ